MVQALLNLDDNTNRVLNTVKAKYDLHDKSEAVSFLVDFYIDEQDDPELRPEFIEEIKKASKQKGIRVKDFDKEFGLNDQ